MSRVGDSVEFVATIALIAYEEKIRYPAAALAYYAFVSFVPVLAIVFLLVGEEFALELSESAPAFLTPEVQLLVARSLRDASSHTGTGVLAVAILLWSSANLAGDVRTVFRQIEGPSSASFGTVVREVAAIFGSLGATIVLFVVASLFVNLPPTGPLLGIPGFVALAVSLTAAFVPLYYVPSKLVSTPMEAVPGALTAAIGWAAIHSSIQFYVAHASQYTIYGVLSGIIIILTSLYVAAAIMLSGIIVNAEFGTAWGIRGT